MRLETNPVREGQLHLGVREFGLLCDLFLEAAGLEFAESSKYMFERRLGEHASELGCGSFYEYYQRLSMGAEARLAIAGALERVTTCETYFLRQDYQLTSFQRECLPRLREAGADARRLTIWSAGCSTGEEVYTLAMLVLESGLFSGWDVKVIGSDLAASRVASARRGVYRERSFRVTPAHVRRRYFNQQGGKWAVSEELKRLCQFGQLNLTDAGAMTVVGKVDVIFCRNVLIYFGQQARAQVIDNLYRRLVPGGYLFLGHSESLLNVSTAFELVHFSEDMAYRRPLLTASRWREP